MGGASGAGGAGSLLAVELCAPLLLLCWLCCWPDDASDTSSGKHPTRPVITNEPDSHRRVHETFARRFGSSAVSLHLPSTSGSTKQSLSAHRSHEEIVSRRRSQEASEDARHHSAPSVIHEVLHRRDWQRSARELHIPLRPALSPSHSDTSHSDDDHQAEQQAVTRTCKKHYTNIKCSKKKESDNDIKDDDVTEISSFYIGDNDAALVGPLDINVPEVEVDKKERVHKAKETKQSLNESIKCKERMKQTLVPVEEFKVSRFEDVPVETDRSGAVHHSVQSRSSLYNAHVTPAPPPSVEAVGYDSDVSYPEEASVWAQAPGTPDGWAREEAWARARHASAGDVLAPARRPQSGALSESELDFELAACDERPPAYHEVHLLSDRKETAI